MIEDHYGELAALVTAMCWAVTGIAFESAGKKVGSLTVNLIRLIIAIFILSLYTFITRGKFFPTDASMHNWTWLALSGLVGFVIGDLCLFQAFVVIGARISSVIMSLTPPIAAFAGWLIMGEVFTLMNFVGMTLTLTGIILVILKRETNIERISTPEKRKRPRFNVNLSPIGLLLGLGGAAGQGVGLVLSKYGMQDYDPFAATQIRVIAGAVGFSLIFTFIRRWKRVGKALTNGKAMTGISIGSFFGPFLGVSFSLLAVKYTTTGIASTLMSITPVIIIAPAVLLFKEKLRVAEIIGALIAVIGVSIFFMG
ncbi:MAG: DMT family transporter [Bacteroidales bacterium]|nr:DMT family transporter [Bacteroidales bacterium]